MLNKSTARHFLAFTLAGAILIPMLPIWQILLRVGAYFHLFEIKASVGTPSKLCSTLKYFSLFSLLAYLLAYVAFFVANPVELTFKTVTNVYGFSPPNVSILFLIASDLFVLLGLSRQFSDHYDNKPRYRVIGISLLIFYVLAIISCFYQSVIIESFSVDALYLSLTGCLEWGVWIFSFFLFAHYFPSQLLKGQLLSIIVFCGFTLSLIVLFQFAIQDYSYYLNDSQLDSFARVKASYYYHAPVSYFLGFSLILSLARFGARKPAFIFFNFIETLIIFSAVFLNGTRATSLSLLLSLSLVFIFFLVRKRLLGLLLSIIMIITFSQSVFILKPTQTMLQDPRICEEALSNGIIIDESLFGDPLEPSPLGDPLEPSPLGDPLEPSPPVNSKTLVAANTGRSVLFYEALSLVPKYSFLGSGPGNLYIPLSGNVFDAIKSTYSSHSLLLDMLLMGGGLAFLSFTIFFFMIVFRTTTPLDDLFHHTKAYFTKAAIVFFFLGSNFFPQERNEILTIVFAAASFVLPSPSVNTKNPSLDLENKLNSCLYNIPIGLVVLFSVIYSALLSPVFFFPTFELLVRQRQLLKESYSIYYTNVSAMNVALPFLKIFGFNSSKVKLITNDIDFDELSNSLIIWSPGAGFEYPALSCRLSAFPSLSRRELGMKIPYDWWLLPSLQQSTSLIYTGPIINPLSEYMDPDKELSVKHNCSNKLYRRNTDVLRPEYPNLSIFSRIKGTNLYSSGQEKVSPYRSSAIDINGTNVVSWGQEKVSPYGSYAIDASDTTTVLWDADQGFVFDIFIPSALDNKPISSYSLLASHSKHIRNIDCYSWYVYGINHGGSPQFLQKQVGIFLSQDSKKPTHFIFDKPASFNHFRFVFSPSSNSADDDKIAGIASIKLFPSEPN